MNWNETVELFKKRNDLVQKLHKGLTEGGVTDPLRMLAIVTAFMSIEELESLAAFQDRGTG